MMKNLMVLLLLLTGVNLFSQQRGISSLNVSIIEVAPSGKVWASTPGSGCAVYDPSLGTWTNFDTSNTIMRSDTITAITLYGIAAVPTSFMATTNGVYYRQGSTWSTLTGLISPFVTGITKSPDNRLYVSTPVGISVFTADSLIHLGDLTTGTSAIPFNNVSGLQFKTLHCNGFYAATPDSGYFYTSDTITYTRVTTGNSNLIDNRVNFILIGDSCHTHYIGTKGGLSVNASGTFTNFTVANGLPQNDVTAVDLDCRGQMWVGTRDSGIGVYNGSTFTTLNITNVLPSNKVRTINCNVSCDCWLGTEDGGIVVLDTNLTAVQIFTGTSQVQHDQSLAVKVYPQPARDVIQFDLSCEITGGLMSLFDVNGRLVLTSELSKVQKFALDTKALNAGLYFYAIKSGTSVPLTGKIAIAR